MRFSNDEMATIVAAWQHGGKKDLLLWKQSGQNDVARSVGNLLLSLLVIRKDRNYKIKVINAFKHIERKVKFALELHDSIMGACLFEEFDEEAVQCVRQEILKILGPQNMGLQEFIESSCVTTKSFNPERFPEDIDRYIMTALSVYAWECEFTVKLSNHDDAEIYKLMEEYFTGIGCSFESTMRGAFRAQGENDTWLIITSVYSERMIISANRM